MRAVAPLNKRSWPLAVIGLAMFAVNCERGVRPTPAPRFALRAGEIPRDSFLAYAATLTFDTTHGAWDEQPLPLVNDSGRVVGMPIIRVESEIGAASLSRSQLAKGRIIARYTAKGPYTPLGIPRGISYVWVDSMGSKFRELVVSEDPSRSAVEHELTIETFRVRGQFAAPRWMVTETALKGCRPCIIYGWCPTDSIRTTGWLDQLLTTPAATVKP